MNQIKKQIENITGADRVHENESMANHTSFKAGGCADLLVEPADGSQLRDVLQLLAAGGTPHMVLGNGSNVLVRDGGYRGVIVKIGDAFNYIRICDENGNESADGTFIVCGAGTLMSRVAKAAASASLTGFEFASGIPGSIGGAVFMNAGAYDGETKNILKAAHLISADGSRQFTMTADELDMGYRHTILHETGDIVTEVVLKLERGKEEDIRALMAELADRRNCKQPVQYPSAGSFFKRPEGYFAGKLVQDAGCKGLTVGGAQVSQLHSGFVINTGDATATDIIQLKELVQARVMDKFGVMLEPEVRIIGEDPIETGDSAADPLDEYELAYDLHTHTTYSHGKGSIEDNVRVALEKGLEYVAISDHGPGHLFYGVNRSDFDNIRNDIDKMSIKYQSINVRNSIEANIIHASSSGRNSNGLDISPDEFGQFDFVIAGFHFGCLRCSSIRNWLWSHGFKAGEESLRRSNTKMICDALKLNDIAILTHPGDKGPFDISEIARTCAETDTLIEINGRHGHLDTEEIKEAARVEGLKFVISSDAHTPDAVGSYRTALQRAIDAGLDLKRIVNIRHR
ncbi:MAG: UDP-N-acetylmuramate dehydrogenase [Clostridia bacterium]|nr:UDP-N-acetylmuramate dehydrogenase [Clostridia bacterium]